MPRPHFIKCRVLCMLVLLAWIPTTSVAKDEPATSESTAPAHAVPKGIPIQLDGMVSSAEWGDALTLKHPKGVGSLAIKQMRGTLMLAFVFERTWTTGTHLMLHFASNERDGASNTPGSVELNYEPLEHDRSHVILSRYGDPGIERLVNKMVVRSKIGDFRSYTEMAIPLRLIEPTMGATKSLRMACIWARGLGHVHTWPAALKLKSSRPPELPAGLASTATWIRLTEFGDPKGSGAISATKWKQLIAEDKEISDRGSRAHAARRLVQEEWRGAAKEDKDFVPEVFDNLAWVGEREPLTNKDLLCLAQSHHWINQFEAALAMYDGLAHSNDVAARHKAGYERARVLESMERFEDAAKAWEAVGKRPGLPPQSVQHYTARAAKARAQGVAHAKEAAARAQLNARDDLPLVEIVTSHGVIVLQLYADDVPKAVKHFLSLVRSKFYDGTLFHRVIGDAFAQGGDPISREQGCDFAGSGTSPEEIDREVNKRFSFWRGAVGFASGMREKNGSQFFIMTAPQPAFTERGYTCFGRVYSGQAVADRLERCDKIIRVRVIKD